MQKNQFPFNANPMVIKLTIYESIFSLFTPYSLQYSLRKEKFKLLSRLGYQLTLISLSLLYSPSYQTILNFKDPGEKNTETVEIGEHVGKQHFPTCFNNVFFSFKDKDEAHVLRGFSPGVVNSWHCSVIRLIKSYLICGIQMSSILIGYSGTAFFTPFTIIFLLKSTTGPLFKFS